MRRYQKWLSLGLMALTPGITLAGALDSPLLKQSTQSNPPKAASQQTRKSKSASNQETANKVKAALGKIDHKGCDIEVIAEDGVVTLDGTVRNKTQRDAVAKAAKVAGVTKVNNRLAVGEPQPDVATQQAAARQAAAKQAEIQKAAVRQAEAQKAAAKQAEVQLAAAKQAETRQAEIRQAAEQQAAVRQAALQQLAAREEAQAQAEAEQKAMAQQRRPTMPRATGRSQRAVRPANYQPEYEDQEQVAQAMPIQAMPVQAMPAQGMPGQGMGPMSVPPAMSPAYGPPTSGASHTVYNQPNFPNYSWPTYAQYPNYAAVTYPSQYSASAWPYIGPFYPYPQVPLGWRKATLEWNDGYWNMNFSPRTDRWWWFIDPKNW